MSTSFVQKGYVLEFTAPSGGVTAGVPVLIGNIIVIPIATAAATVRFQGARLGVHNVPKADSQAWVEGAILYLDNTAHVFTTVSTANFRAGVATQAVAATAGLIVGQICLDGIGITAVGGVAP